MVYTLGAPLPCLCRRLVADPPVLPPSPPTRIPASPNRRPQPLHRLLTVCHAQVKKEHVDDMAAKLREARKVYEQDSETLHWFVMQDVHDATKFTIVERFVKESSQEEHLSNPYWASASVFPLHTPPPRRADLP